jgi:hypothetical protein
VSRTLTIAGYAVPLVIALAVELRARRDGSRLPTAGELATRISSGRAGRCALLLGWWWLGWHFFVR